MTAGRRALIVVAVFVAVASGCLWGGAVREASAQISVTAADPPTGEQGTAQPERDHQGQGLQERREGEVLQDRHRGPRRRQRQVHAVRELDPVDCARRHRRRALRSACSTSRWRTPTAAPARARSCSAWSRKRMATSPRLPRFRLPFGWTTQPATRSRPSRLQNHLTPGISAQRFALARRARTTTTSPSGFATARATSIPGDPWSSISVRRATRPAPRSPATRRSTIRRTARRSRISSAFRPPS